MILLTVLIVITVVTAVSWIAKILRGRRHLYAAARKAKGPSYFPIFGVSINFLKNPWGFVDVLNGYFEQYPGLYHGWFGSQSIYAINKPEYLKIVMNNPNCYGKMMYMYKSLQYIGGQGLVTTDDVPHWKTHRKIINPAFNQRILDGYMEVFVSNCSIFMEKLKNLDGKGEFNVQEFIYKCNLDIVCESMMGVKVYAQTKDSTYHKVFERLLDVALLRMINIGYHMDWYFNRTKLYAQNVENLRILHEFTNNVIRTKRQQHENKKTKIDTQMQIESKDYIKCKAFADLLIEEESFTETEIRDEIVTFILAGSDTSTGTIGFTLIMLAMHPKIQDKVLEEILSVVGPDRDLEYKDLPQLKYLECCMKETLRLFPAVLFMFRQVVEDVKLDDEITLPKGSGILIGVGALHRWAKYWPDPLRFDPDRFLPENVAERHQYAYIPFSGGPRNCIGYRFAFMSMKTMVATVVRRYKMTTSYKSVSDIELRANILLKAKNGVKISLQHR